MNNIAYTPCHKCKYVDNGCCLMPRLVDCRKFDSKDNKTSVRGWCRYFSERLKNDQKSAKDHYQWYKYNHEVKTNTYSVLIYLDKDYDLCDLNKTITGLMTINHYHLFEEGGPEACMEQWIIFDNTGIQNKILPKFIDSCGFPNYKLEQRLESDTSFEKAIDISMKRLANQDFLIAVKVGSDIEDYTIDSQIFTVDHDTFSHIFWPFNGTEGIYLCNAFLQLGGGPRFIDKLLYFQNSSDLIKQIKGII